MQINVQRRLAESNAAGLISKVRNMFPTALLTPCISLRKQMISNIFEMFTNQKQCIF